MAGNLMCWQRAYGECLIEFFRIQPLRWINIWNLRKEKSRYSEIYLRTIYQASSSICLIYRTKGSKKKPKRPDNRSQDLKWKRLKNMNLEEWAWQEDHHIVNFLYFPVYSWWVKTIGNIHKNNSKNASIQVLHSAIAWILCGYLRINSSINWFMENINFFDS